MPSVSLESESTMIVRAKLIQPTWALTFNHLMEKRNQHVINHPDSTQEGRETVIFPGVHWTVHCQYISDLHWSNLFIRQCKSRACLCVYLDDNIASLLLHWVMVLAYILCLCLFTFDTVITFCFLLSNEWSFQKLADVVLAVTSTVKDWCVSTRVSS